MLLSNLIGPNEGLKLHGNDVDITGLITDSRATKRGDLFIAVPGTKQDGRTYIKDALDKGAVAVLVPEGTNGLSVPYITTPDIRSTVANIAATFYPRQPEHIAAVTGTSGKTSIAQFARQLWQNNGHVSASVGTLGLVTAKETRYGSLTTPDPITLHKTLDEAAGNGITHLAMEASSHGLDLHRLDRVNVHVGAFTNLSRDHLDYHEDMESYLAAKLRLFTEIMPEGSTAVLNADVPEYGVLSMACKDCRHAIIDYGKRANYIRLKDYELHLNGQLLRFSVIGKNHEILLPVAGEFQVWNSLCALGMAIGSGDPIDQSVASMEKLTGVPGRLERIGATKKGGTVFVDYAHKPGALENVLTAMRSHVAARPGGRLFVVFGCGGNRDKGKRPQMGEIAIRLADVVIVTDDNPRNEVPTEIRKDILAGCAPGPNLREIGDRAEAIQTAISELEEGDVLVIAGKGHETGQIVGDRVLPFDDAEVARQALGK